MAAPDPGSHHCFFHNKNNGTHLPVTPFHVPDLTMDFEAKEQMDDRLHGRASAKNSAHFYKK
jgi:hypothetical protein